MVRIVVTIDPDIKELIPGFIKNRYEDIFCLQQHILNRDFNAIRILGHSMKGFGAGYGFYGISDLGASLESAAIREDIPELEVLHQEFSNYLEQIDIVYE